MVARKTNVTLSDIASEVGVSRALVGKVLGGGSGNIRVSKETAQIIREAAQRLHYQPNLSARVLTGQRSQLIGVLIDAQPPQVTFRTLACIDRYAVKKGFRLLIGEAHDSIDSLYQHYSNFMQYNVDGVICLAHDYPGQEEKFRELFSNVDNIVYIEKPLLDNSRCVEVDRAAAMEELTTLLLRTRKRVGIIMEDPQYRSIRQRQGGYCRGEMMEQVVEEFILPKQLDAVIAPNDLAASHIMRHLMRQGFRIPEDIAVAGYDNDPFSESLYPSLTTIDDNNDLIGKYAVTLLTEQLTAADSSPRSLRVTPRIIRRESI